MSVLCECDFTYWCPICGLKLDYTPCYIEVRKCPNNHYEEVHYHYGSDFVVGEETFHFDDGGYSQPIEEVKEAIKIVRDRLGLPEPQVKHSCELFFPPL